MPDDDNVIEFSSSRFRKSVIWLFVWQVFGFIFGFGSLFGCIALPWVEPFSLKFFGVELTACLLMVAGLAYFFAGFASYKLIFKSTIPKTDHYLIKSDRLQRYSREGKLVEEIPFDNFADIKMITKRSQDNPEVTFKVLGITLRNPDDSRTKLDEAYVRWSRGNHLHDIVMSEEFFDVPLKSVLKKIRKRWQQWQEDHEGEAIKERKRAKLRPQPWHKSWEIYLIAGLVLAVFVNIGVKAMTKSGGGGRPGPAAGKGSDPDNNGPANKGPAGAEPSPLMAHWPMDEGQGSATVNKVGSYAGSLTVGADWGTGMKGPCIKLDGKAGYVDMSGISLQFAKGTPFTITGWANKNPDTGDGVICSFRNLMSNFPVIEISVRNHQLAGWVRDDASGQGGAKVSGGQFDDGRWHHVALVRSEDGTIEIFLDGTSQGKAKGTNSAGAIIANYSAFGCDRKLLLSGKNSPAFFAGSLGDFRIFNRALSAQEIATSANER